MKKTAARFSIDEMLDVLDGRKSQFRKVVNPQPRWRGKIIADWFSPMVIRKGQQEPGDDVFGFSNEEGDETWVSPFGSPGDHLWIQEPFMADIRHPRDCVVYQATPEIGKHCDSGDMFRPAFKSNDLPQFWKRKPTAHMPRWASRLTLEVLRVWVERLHDISKADAIAEGIVANDGRANPVREFRSRWESVHGRYSWAANPWVWCCEFRRVENGS